MRVSHVARGGGAFVTVATIRLSSTENWCHGLAAPCEPFRMFRRGPKPSRLYRHDSKTVGAHEGGWAGPARRPAAPSRKRLQKKRLWMAHEMISFWAQGGSVNVLDPSQAPLALALCSACPETEAAHKAHWLERKKR